MSIEELLNELEPKYEGIVNVAQHCDQEKLNIAQDNARRYDMTSLVCDLTVNWDEVEDNEDEIFIGGVVNGIPFGGLNLIFSLYSYARYVENSIYTDTGSGFVRKDHSNSFPVQMNELKDIASEHRKFAANEITRLKSHLCSKGQGGCVCGSSICDNNTRPTLTARKYKNVSRRR